MFTILAFATSQCCMACKAGIFILVTDTGGNVDLTEDTGYATAQCSNPRCNRRTDVSLDQAPALKFCPSTDPTTEQGK